MYFKRRGLALHVKEMREMSDSSKKKINDPDNIKNLEKRQPSKTANILKNRDTTRGQNFSLQCHRLQIS